MKEADDDVDLIEQQDRHDFAGFATQTEGTPNQRGTASSGGLPPVSIEEKALFAKANEEAPDAYEMMIARMSQRTAKVTAQQMMPQVRQVAKQAAEEAVRPLRLTLYKAVRDIAAANAANNELKRRLDDGAGGAASGASGGRDSAGGGSNFSAPNSLHVPQYVDVAGFIIDQDDAQASALHGDTLKDHWNAIYRLLQSDATDLIDKERSERHMENRLWHYMITFFLKEPSIKEAGFLKTALEQALQRGPYKSNGKELWVRMQGNPQDQSLRRAAARMWSTVELAGASTKDFRSEWIKRPGQRQVALYATRTLSGRPTKAIWYIERDDTYHVDSTILTMVAQGLSPQAAVDRLNKK